MPMDARGGLVLDNDLKTQLQGYLERLSQPVRDRRRGG